MVRDRIHTSFGSASGTGGSEVVADGVKSVGPTLVGVSRPSSRPGRGNRIPGQKADQTGWMKQQTG